MFSLCWYRLTLTLTKLRRFQPRHKIEEVHVLADQRSDRLAELEDQYAGYEIYDRDGEKIGSVNDLFVDENDDLKYIGVKTGPLATKPILIPMDAARVDKERRTIEVSQPKSKVHEGPTLDEDRKITPEFERQVRNYYGIGSSRNPADRGFDEKESHTERAEAFERGSGAATRDFDEERSEDHDQPPVADHEGATYRDVESSFEGYQVYDRHYEKIGKVDDLFVDESDLPEYIGVKIGFLGTRTTLIPLDVVRVNDKRRLVEVEADKDTVKEGPTFSEDREITPEFERRVLNYYQVEIAQFSADKGIYGPYYSKVIGDEQVDVFPGERAGTHERLVERQPVSEMRGADRERGDRRDEEDLEALGSEEESRAKASERQADRVNVRKRTRTDSQRPTERNITPDESGATTEEASPRIEISRTPSTTPRPDEDLLAETRGAPSEDVQREGTSPEGTTPEAPPAGLGEDVEAAPRGDVSEVRSTTKASGESARAKQEQRPTRQAGEGKEDKDLADRAEDAPRSREELDRKEG
jgi:sporulation protein YlmC with PRC-barrel domain